MCEDALDRLEREKRKTNQNPLYNSENQNKKVMCEAEVFQDSYCTGTRWAQGTMFRLSANLLDETPKSGRSCVSLH